MKARAVRLAGFASGIRAVQVHTSLIGKNDNEVQFDMHNRKDGAFIACATSRLANAGKFRELLGAALFLMPGVVEVTLENIP